jgi:trehalose 2-sulfotransferase
MGRDEDAVSRDPATAFRASYVICTTPRSGSNFLCELLQSTEVAGRPDEYFWDPPAGHERWSPEEYRAYVERIQQAGTTPSGVFGLKLMWGYFDAVVARLATLTGRAESSPPAILATVFPNLKYVWLTRRDKVRQAISWHRALASQRWRSTDATAEGTPEPTFDFAAIDGLVDVATADDRSWRDFFTLHGIAPLVIVYEELEQDPEQACRQVLDFLGLSVSTRSSSRVWRHQRQADGLTDAWVRRYHALKGGTPG